MDSFESSLIGIVLLIGGNTDCLCYFLRDPLWLLLLDWFVIPDIKQLVLKAFNLGSEHPLVIDGKAFEDLIKFFQFMLEDIQGITIGSHAILVGLVVYLLDHILECFLDVVPGRVQIIHVYLQVIVMHLAEADIFSLLCPEILEVVLPHSLDHLS